MVKGIAGGIDEDQCRRTAAAPALRWDRPVGEPRATLVLAHGAGAPMDSPFLEEITARLVARGLQVVRFEFPYMARRRLEGGRRPPDPQPRLLACWRAVHATVRQQVAGPLLIGGKSMGGRMASLLADELAPAALVCFGYPFHAAGKPERPRVAHLATLQTPCLIIQGERDALGNRERVADYALSAAVRLHWLAAADHDLKPLKASGLTAGGHLDSAADALLEFLRQTGLPEGRG